MHIPVKVDYAVRALVDLTRHRNDGTVHAWEIARRMAMPAPYCDQILHTLKMNGFTRTLRGPRGGHSLAMNPEDINLSMVMAAFNETGTIVGCLANVDVCVLSDVCTQRSIWQTVEEAVHEILDRTTIADLVQPIISVPVKASKKVLQQA